MLRDVERCREMLQALRDKGRPVLRLLVGNLYDFSYIILFNFIDVTVRKNAEGYSDDIMKK